MTACKTYFEANNIELSVIILVFNQSSTIKKILRDWTAFLDEEIKNYEIIVVNNGSTDGSGRIIDRMRKENPSIRAIHQLQTVTGVAVKRGYEASRGNYVVHIEPSGRFEPNDIIALLNFRKGNDLVIAKRTHRLDNIFSQVSSKLFSYFLKLLFKIEITEPNISFRIYDQAALRGAMLQLPAYSYHTDLLLSIIIHNSGGKIVEAPVPFRFSKIKITNSSGKFAAFVIGLYEIIKLRLTTFLNNIGVLTPKTLQN